MLLKFSKIYLNNSIKYRLHENNNIVSSDAHGLLNYTTRKMVTDLYDAEREKRLGKGFQCLDDPPESSSEKKLEKSKAICT